ncbi:MAG: dipeptidyl peptidase 3 [Candidatus Latescibacteria bacterium]|nr:dipeptidyl peptidase 3 [Candidatus Latescibacterota bacterium]
MTKQRTPPQATEPLVGELERIGPDGRDAVVVGVEAPGFDDLPAREKRFLYCMTRAAIAGNGIAFQQSHRDADDIARLLEACFMHADGLDPAVRDALHEYLKLVWIHHGPYHHHTHAKFTPPRLTHAMLAVAAQHASSRGASFPLRAGESVDALLARLHRSIFDLGYEPVQTNQSSGVDVVATSAVNYYDPGVTKADVDALPEWRERVNVRFAVRDGRVVPEVFRIGGVFGPELETVSHFVRLALPHAENDEQRAAIRSLLEFYATGDERHFREHMIHWLQSGARVDYLNGFIESYLDPRGVIGQFEGNASFRAGGGTLERIAENAPYFEAKMPWPDAYRRSDVSRPVALMVNVVVETGDAGPVSPAAYNLPNYNDIRRDHGSKNVILYNIENTRTEGVEQAVVNEFFLPEYRDAVLSLSHPLTRPLKVFLHEVIGHGSGRPDPALGAMDPRARLGRVYSSLEEARADLVALYHIGDPKLSEIGAYDAGMRDLVVETAFVSYLQGWMARMDRVEGHEVREAHDRGHHTILMWLVRGGERKRDYGVEVIKVDGDYFVRVTDTDRAHEGVGELLLRLQVIKSTGDADAAHRIFDDFGTRLDPAWKANIAARREKLKLPKLKAFVFPRLSPVVRGDEIVDVKIAYDEDLTAQQLRFRRLEHSRSLEAD